MRANDLETCVVRVEGEQGQTLGTGFLVGPDLAVTCAHVVRVAGAGPGQTVAVCFHRDGSRHTAQVLARPWSPPDEEDVAFLRPESVPQRARPATLGPAAGSSGHDFLALGYPEGGDVEARWPQGKIGGMVPVAGREHGLLQVQGAEVDPGLSGAPVLDLTTGRVVGMVTGYQEPARPPLRQRCALPTPPPPRRCTTCGRRH